MLTKYYACGNQTPNGRGADLSFATATGRVASVTRTSAAEEVESYASDPEGNRIASHPPPFHQSARATVNRDEGLGRSER